MQRLVLILPVEEQTKKDGPGISHSNELEMVREQPRASPTSTPAQSLPLTSRPGGPGSQCRAGLSYRLVQLSQTLCLMYISPHVLSENVIKDYEKESEPQKMPTPICPLLSQSVLGHLLAYIYYCMVDPIKICLSPSVKGALPDVAKEQHLYELNRKKSYSTTKMFFWREIQDEGIDANVTFEPKQMHGVLKPFFASVGKIVKMVFRGFWECSRRGSVNMDDDGCADAASTLESIKRAKIGDMRGRKYTLVGKTAHLDFNCRGLNCQDDLTVTAP